MRSVIGGPIGGLMEWLYGLWRQRAAEFYGDQITTDPDAGAVTREGRRYPIGEAK